MGFILKFLLGQAYSDCLILRCTFATFTPNQSSIKFYDKVFNFYIKIKYS